ncbi:DUF5670 family protein [Streptomyces sp. NPDC047141]|uniref:DUF5670 family protein n=2 Tax=Streptomyces TaxID=1883 RepID=UPI0033E7C3AF
MRYRTRADPRVKGEWARAHRRLRRYLEMVPLLLVLLLVLVLFGAGFALNALWWIAVILLVVWLLGFVARPKSGSGRWYRW